MTYPETGHVSDATPVCIPSATPVLSIEEKVEEAREAIKALESEIFDDQDDDALGNGECLPRRTVIVPIQGHVMSFSEFSKIISENAPKLHRVSSVNNTANDLTLVRNSGPAQLIRNAIHQSVRFSEWKFNVSGNCFQLETLDKVWYVQVTGDKGWYKESFTGTEKEEDETNLRSVFYSVGGDTTSEALVVVCRGLTSYPLYDRDEANNLFETIRHAQHTIQMSLLQVRTPHIPWEETDDEPTGENLQAQLDIVDLDTAEIKNLHHLTVAIEEFMSGVKSGYGGTSEDDSSPATCNYTWDYTHYTIPILDTLVESLDLPEWKFIPGGVDSPSMYLLWTEKDSWLLRVRREDTTFYRQGRDPFPVADGKNARLLYDLFSGEGKPFRESNDDDDVFGEVVGDYVPEEVLKGVKTANTDEDDFFVDTTMDEALNSETLEEKRAEETTKENEETMKADTPNQDVECQSCFDEEGSTKCVRPSHKPKTEYRGTTVDAQAAEKGTINYLKSVEGRVLTVLEAALSDKGQRDAVKTLIKKEFRRTMNQVNRAQTPNDEE